MGHVSVLKFLVSLVLVSALGILISADTSLQAQTSVAAEPDSAGAASEATAATDSSAAAAEKPSNLPEAGKISYEPHIRQILAEHCLECHGPKTAKADLRVDERTSLLSYVAPGDLESSSLWGDYLTTSDPDMRMPPAKFGKPLSELELAAIRVWIEDGAAWPETQSQPAKSAAGSPQRNYLQKVWTFVGFLHPAVVHFPIGLLLVSTLFCMLAFVKRPTFEPAAFHCLWIGAVGAVAASLAGWSFAEVRGYGDFWNTEWSRDLVARHRISGLSVTTLAIVVSFIASAARQRASTNLHLLWLLGALCLAGLVGITGHQGGELTYGEDLYDRAYTQAFGGEKKIAVDSLEGYGQPPSKTSQALEPATNLEPGGSEQPAAESTGPGAKASDKAEAESPTER